MSYDREKCRCGHDHRTFRDEEVRLCLDCSCDELAPVAVCDNCERRFEPDVGFDGKRDYCSRACSLQHEWARTRAAA